jgi:predicted nucleotidyltransferase
MTQQRVLALLFGQPDRTFLISDLIELAGSGSGAVQREVSRLAASGLVETVEIERRKKYRANRAAPIFDELCSIVEKTIGIGRQLQVALEAIAGRIAFAMLFGSVAKGSDRAASDIDVLIISDELLLEDVYKTLSPIEERLGRKISPTILTSAEFAKRKDSGNPFLKKIFAGPHVVLIGQEDAEAKSR